MKGFTLIFFLFLSINAFCQDAKDPVEVTPEVQKKIMQEVNISATQLKKRMDNEKSHTQLYKQFALDTFRVNHFYQKWIELDYSTAGMHDATYNAIQMYDSLLNKYYKKLVKVLKEDKATLIQAQKSWIQFRDNEMKLTELEAEKCCSGGSIVPIIIDSAYLELTKKRTIEIFEHYSAIMQDQDNEGD